MKFDKIYHALTADPTNKWKESFRETIDIDPQQAEDANSRFEHTGIKYISIEATPVMKDPTSASKVVPKKVKPEAPQEPTTEAV